MYENIPMVFICWSGKRSKALAEHLHEFLKKATYFKDLNPQYEFLKPWFSEKDISLGEWLKTLTNALQKSVYGLFCLTPENINARWISYELGSLVMSHNLCDMVKDKLRELHRQLVDKFGKNQDLNAIFDDFQKNANVNKEVAIFPYLFEISNVADLPDPFSHYHAFHSNKASTKELLKRIYDHQLQTGIKPRIQRNYFLEHLDRVWDEMEMDSRISDVKDIALPRIPVQQFHEKERFAIGKFGKSLLEDIRNTMVSTSFAGEVNVFNIELQTIKDYELWNLVLQDKHVSSVKLAITRKVFHKLLEGLNSTPEIKETFGYQDKMRVFPILPSKNTKGVAFADFRNSSNPNKSFTYIFPKNLPHSVWEPDWIHEECVYLFFERSNDSEFLSPLRQDFRKCTHIWEGLSIREIMKFLCSTPISLDKVYVKNEAHIPEAQLKTHLPCPETVYSKIGDIRLSEQVRHKSRKVWVGTIEKRPNVEILQGSPNISRSKPTLLWLPPWGQLHWFHKVKDLDKVLSREFNVLHLNFQENSQNYTFSRAEQEACQAVQLLDRYRANMGLGNGLVIVGVSINAYIAASLAAQFNIPDLWAMAFLSPSVDLFDGIDSFCRFQNDIELFATRAFLGKNGFKINDDLPIEIRFFDQRTQPYYILDMRMRGRTRCDREGFLQHLNKILDKIHDPDSFDNPLPLFFAHCRKDDMISYHDVSQVVEQLNLDHGLGTRLKINDYAWRHDLSENVFFCPAAGDRMEFELSGLSKLIDYLHLVAQYRMQNGDGNLQAEI